MKILLLTLFSLSAFQAQAQTILDLESDTERALRACQRASKYMDHEMLRSRLMHKGLSRLNKQEMREAYALIQTKQRACKWWKNLLLEEISAKACLNRVTQVVAYTRKSGGHFPRTVVDFGVFALYAPLSPLTIEVSRKYAEFDASYLCAWSKSLEVLHEFPKRFVKGDFTPLGEYAEKTAFEYNNKSYSKVTGREVPYIGTLHDF